MKQDESVVMTQNTIAATNKHVSHYWDRVMPIDEAALLLKVSIKELKLAALERRKILGSITAPPYFVTEAGKMMFKGRDIEKIYQAFIEERNNS